MDPLPTLSLGGVAVSHLAVADGVDLGLGMLVPLARRRRDRDLLMQGITPFWHGNEPWSVFGAATLCAAGPVVYHALPSALHPPVVAMLSALILRGIALEATAWERCYRDLLLAAGSLVAASCQGLVMAGWARSALTQDAHSDGLSDCLSMLGFLCAACIVGGYVLLGAGYWYCARVATRDLGLALNGGQGRSGPARG